MKKINKYITEKLRINKEIYFFDEENFTKILDKYKLDPDSLFAKHLLEWFNDYHIKDIDIYGWDGINRLQNTDRNIYIENETEFKRLKKQIIESGKEKVVKNKNVTKVFYYTDSLFAMFTEDKNLGIIAKKK